MSEFIDGVADVLVGSGIGTGRYSTSGTSVQVNYRRDFGTDVTYVLLKQTGGQAFPHDAKELQSFQVLVDGSTLSGTRAKARAVFDQLHETIAEQISGGHKVLWLRAVTLPQAIPTGPAADGLRFQFSTNFDALLVKA